MSAHSRSGSADAAPSVATESRGRLARRLLGVARPVLAPLGISIVSRLIALLLGVALFAIGGWVVASHGVGATSWTIGTTALVLVVISLVKALFRYLEQFSGHYVAFRSLALLRTYFYDKLEPQAPGRTEGEDSGDLLSRVTKDIDRIEVFFAHTLAPGITAIIAPVIILVWLGSETSWWIALTLLPFLVLVGAIVPAQGVGRTDRAARRIRERRGALAQHVTDSVQGVREVLAFNHQDARLEEMAVVESEIGEAQRVSSRVVSARRGANQFLVAAALIAVLIVGAALCMRGELSVPQLGLALGTTLGSFAPMLAVEDFSADLDQAFASARRVFTITEREPLVSDPVDPKECSGRGDLCLEGVSFRYPALGVDEDDAGGSSERGSAGGRRAGGGGSAGEATGRGGAGGAATGRGGAGGAATRGGGAGGAARDAGPGPGLIERPEVLHDVSMVFPAGRVTAVVGASGSGKSTVASLLERVWDPEAGAIRLGEVDIRDLSQQRLRELIAFAPQRPYIFNDTVRANLLLARPEATDEQLARVCRQVGLSEWLESEPDGLDTQVGEMGERLSGGQRQRVALARALVRDAPVTILDEATSQLDRDTEAHVLEGIRQATQGRTLIVIAHRISTVMDADRIVVLDSGRVVEAGTAEELMQAGGAFAALLAREPEEVTADAM